MAQLITGKSTLTGEEASRFWAAVGVVPVAGGMFKRVGEPSVEVLAKLFKGGETVKPVTGLTDTVNASSALQGASLHAELSALTRIAPDLSRDAEYLARTDRSLLQKHNFDMDHVLAGEVNAAGKATGYHAELAADGASRIKPGASVTHNANGTYEAPVQLWDAGKGQWVDKARESTFFPPSWSHARIEYEVTEAFKSKQLLGGQKWQGTTPSGIVIEGYTNPTRTTFYPTK